MILAFIVFLFLAYLTYDPNPSCKILDLLLLMSWNDQSPIIRWIKIILGPKYWKKYKLVLVCIPGHPYILSNTTLMHQIFICIEKASSLLLHINSHLFKIYFELGNLSFGKSFGILGE